MDFVAKYFEQILGACFILASLSLVGAGYIAVELFFEIRKTTKALAECSERYKVED